MTTYWKCSWKYGKTAEIISKFTAAPSLTIPNNNLILLFEFSIRVSCLIYFPSMKFHHLRWRNTHDVIILVAKTVTAFQHNRWRKNILSSFWHRLGHESARALLCKLATYTRQIFLSKLKLLQTRQTNRKNRKQSKAETGYD